MRVKAEEQLVDTQEISTSYFVYGYSGRVLLEESSGADTSGGSSEDSDTTISYTSYIYAFSKTFAKVDGVINTATIATEISYFHHDNLGSTRLMTDCEGKVIMDQDYLPFGDDLPRVGQVGVMDEEAGGYKYTGQKEVVSIGLYYYGARYYDPEIGRFITEDTYPGEMGNPQSQNLYVYVMNNPMKYVDPSGNVYLIAWSYGKKDVREFEEYINDNGGNLIVDGFTDEWNDSIMDEFIKRSSFKRAAYTRKKELLEMGIPEENIDVQRIDSKEDLEATWDMWAKYDIIEGLDFFSHGYYGGAEVYKGSGTIWENAKKLNFDSTLRFLKIDGEWTGYISSPYAVFYGCNTANGDFAQNFANFQQVTTYAQTDYASFSYSKQYRFRKIDTHGSSHNIYLLSFESWNGLKNNDYLGKKFTPQGGE